MMVLEASGLVRTISVSFPCSGLRLYRKPTEKVVDRVMWLYLELIADYRPRFLVGNSVVLNRESKLAHVAKDIDELDFGS